ncbi:GatB/YqeY domain-containing protein [Roseobacter sp. HKCCA0434]|uniref:GatB/YqeY domain-containing protein n=1 Tax=Roseobacter sp. HKCCA0434 TaxID=3079297 RepID=UPI002905C048|nr:GatB/YqeY domain-containing protein [Roseobacter sp. HKCCA0434]
MLRERISTETKGAMKAKDSLRLSTLRLISAAIKDRDIAARAGDNAEGVSDDEILSILSKMIKQRRDSVKAYEEAGRLELAEQEQAEIDVISEFLPRMLTDEETEAAIAAAMQKVGASSIRDMGKVMGELKTTHAGQMDFGKVGGQVKARLG